MKKGSFVQFCKGGLQKESLVALEKVERPHHKGDEREKRGVSWVGKFTKEKKIKRLGV